MNFETTEEQTKMPKWKLLLLGCGGIILIMIMVHAMNESIELEKNSERDKTPILSGTVISVSSISLQNEFALYADSATKKYKDKIVLVNGKIAEIDKYNSGESFLIFEKAKEVSKIKIECSFKKESAIDSLAKGQNVAVQGTLNFMKNIILIENSQIKK
jgi:hypothetical protein